MAEYIDREGLMQFPIRREHCDKEHANEHFINGIETVLEYAESLPAADVAPVRHGEWEIVVGSNGKEYMVCTCCRVSQDLTGVFTYCPNCGCRMDGGADNEM